MSGLAIGAAMKTTDKEIEEAVESEDWTKARQLIRRELRRDPGNHWLLTRLSTSYYEEKKYQKALEISETAVALAPTCPLVLWDYACALDMYGRTEDAVRIWKRLRRAGQRRLDRNPCSEGRAWCRSLLNDCRYRLAIAFAELGQVRAAIRYMRGYLKARTNSIYERDQAQKRLQEFIAIRSSSTQ